MLVGDDLKTKDMEKHIIAGQKRALIIKIGILIHNLKQDDLNEKLKMYYLHTNLYLKKLKNKLNKGLNTLISLYGDPEKIIKDYEDAEGFSEEQ